MLTQLHIKDFAIIDQLELDIHAGMTSMTGETGAGKSILLDALGLVLGDRAEASFVRFGSSKADISATFDTSALPQIHQQLEELDLDSDDECIIRRVISKEGRSKAYINGNPVTLQTLKNIGDQLVDIHGQHEHQSLLKNHIQRLRLDDYGKHSNVLQQCASSYTAWRDTQQQLDHLRNAEHQRSERLDLLRFQVNELEELDLQEQEWQSIQEEHQRLAHAEQLILTTQQVINTLSEQEESNICQLLGQQQGLLEQQAERDAELAEVVSNLNTALIHTEEASSALRSYADRLEINPERLQQLEARMGLIHELSRKHQCSPEELIPRLDALSSELQQIENADATLAELDQRCDEQREQYIHICDNLHQLRKSTASSLSALVTDAMQQLGMEGGKLDIGLTRDLELFSATGQNRIEFLVSANPGQPLKALSKVASGGELSRISLAIQMITASCEKVPTLIFDEVDTGIGGGVAEIVGKHLRQLGQSRQVLCVTHLPQVASQAHQHLKVAKLKAEDMTTTGIQPLKDKERVSEIARMLGGVEITEQTLKHAEEMIQRASA